MNNKSLQPQPTTQPITFDTILSIHNYLSNVKDPSETIKLSIQNIENHIYAFIASLSTGPNK